MMLLSRKAEIAFHTLQPQDMEQVQRSIELLDMYPHDVLNGKIKKLPDTDDLFVMEADPDIRIIFRIAGADREVTDIVRYERLKRMFGAYRRGSKK